MKSVYDFAPLGWYFFIAGLALSVIRYIWPESITGVFSFLFVAVETCLLISGFIGVFIKHFNTNNRLWRYFSDSSYWVYLSHLFFVSIFQIGLLHSMIPSFLKPILVFSGALLISLLSYQYLVRYTFIGNSLHGKRERVPKH
jgi:glucan biosynthesis protein C